MGLGGAASSVLDFSPPPASGNISSHQLRFLEDAWGGGGASFMWMSEDAANLRCVFPGNELLPAPDNGE